MDQDAPPGAPADLETMNKGAGSAVAPLDPPVSASSRIRSGYDCPAAFGLPSASVCPSLLCAFWTRLAKGLPLVGRATLHSPQSVSAETSTLEAPQAPDWPPS